MGNKTKKDERNCCTNNLQNESISPGKRPYDSSTGMQWGQASTYCPHGFAHLTNKLNSNQTRTPSGRGMHLYYYSRPPSWRLASNCRDQTGHCNPSQGRARRSRRQQDYYWGWILTSTSWELLALHHGKLEVEYRQLERAAVRRQGQPLNLDE